jgi:hypothetical protein
MAVYLHASDGEYCPLMNSFDTTPEEVLQEMIRSILNGNEFIYFNDMGGSRFHEFVIMFKRDAEVRSLVYEKIALLSGEGGNTANAKKLFALVLTVLSDIRMHFDERRYTILISEFFTCFGLSFEKAITKIDGLDGQKIEPLKQEMEFQKKYVHNMQTEDKFDISSWA